MQIIIYFREIALNKSNSPARINSSIALAVDASGNKQGPSSLVGLEGHNRQEVHILEAKQKLKLSLKVILA